MFKKVCQNLRSAIPPQKMKDRRITVKYRNDKVVFKLIKQGKSNLQVAKPPAKGLLDL